MNVKSNDIQKAARKVIPIELVACGWYLQIYIFTYLHEIGALSRLLYMKFSRHFLVIFNVELS